MSKKVWVIEESPGKEVSPARTDQKAISTFQNKSVKKRNHALAYSLSIMLWGAGQFFNRQWRLGILFLLCMINFYGFMSILYLYWGAVTSAFASIFIDRSGTLLICGFFYLAGLIVWHVNAWQAYVKSIKIHAESPKGIRSSLLPAAFSLLMPGWGQLLNGQPIKGIFFQFFALAGLATFPVILVVSLLWPTLEASPSRNIIEWIFSTGILLIPCILIMWIFSIFDAAKVSMDQTKKEPLSLRIKFAKGRFRHTMQLYGWKSAILPFIKRTLLVSLLLIFCAVTYQYIPQTFYMQQLQSLGKRMSEKEMTIIPGIIKKFSDHAGVGT